ncbi:hypothetical protein [Anaerospora hongkongensis]|uniref:hypothetical protein n=1 Tax=Anaerospora hongkongensis TaxID=244830 RepID=UPI002899ABF9|nr:hypothetical protein [Anaerospora hongkongensis]
MVSLLPPELTLPDETARWEMIFEEMVAGTARQVDFIEQQKAWNKQKEKLARYAVKAFYGKEQEKR